MAAKFVPLAERSSVDQFSLAIIQYLNVNLIKSEQLTRKQEKMSVLQVSKLFKVRDEDHLSFV